MRKIKRLYGLLVIVLAALIVLTGIWIPETLLEKKAESLSSGKTAVVDNREVTPYTYTMSVESRIPKLAEFLLKLRNETGLEAGADIREPLDTELTQQQAVDRATDFLQKLNEVYENWGLNSMFYPVNYYDTMAGDTEVAVAAENTAGIGTVDHEMDAQTAADDAYSPIADSVGSLFFVDEQQQQLSLWWLCFPDSYGNTVYVAVDAVTGLLVLVQYMAGDEASMIEYADAVRETYTSVCKGEYSFASATVAAGPSVGYVDGSEYVVFTCEGKRLSLECQYYYFGKKTGDKVKDINSRTGEVWIWLLAS